jgi:hypothetical protein
MGSVMVWAGISAQGKTDLHIIENGIFTTVRYVNEILAVDVRTYDGAVGPDFIFMDDNAHVNRAHVTNRYLEEATIVYMDWPARSPDLNPIEHAPDILQNPFLHATSNQQQFMSSAGGSSAACNGDARPYLMHADTILSIKHPKPTIS